MAAQHLLYQQVRLARGGLKIFINIQIGYEFANLESNNARYSLLFEANGKLELIDNQEGGLVIWVTQNTKPATAAILMVANCYSFMQKKS